MSKHFTLTQIECILDFVLAISPLASFTIVIFTTPSELYREKLPNWKMETFDTLAIAISNIIEILIIFDLIGYKFLKNYTNGNDLQHLRNTQVISI